MNSEVTNQYSAGFTFNAQLYVNPRVWIWNADKSDSHESINNFMQVTHILNDTLSLKRNYTEQGGMLSMAVTSNIMLGSQWAIETGQVADQSFAGGPFAPMAQPLLYNGDGDYSTIYTGLANNSINITSTATNSSLYQVSSAEFGRMVFNSSGAPYSGYYVDPGTTPSYAALAYNFQGLALPAPLWVDVVALMH